MEMQQLRTFLAVVDERSFTKAAEEMHLSQPAVTRQIGALEQQVGARLLERRIRRVIPTAAGEALYGYATRILGIERECRARILEVERGVAGRLRVSASGTAATYLLPGCLGKFRTQHPGIDLSVWTCSSDEAARMVQEERADAGVVMDLRPHPDLKEIRLGRYSLVAVMAPYHKLARRKSLAVEELVKEDLIVMQGGTNLRQLVNTLFQAHGAALQAAIEVDHVEAMKKMAAAGLGVAIVPDVAVGDAGGEALRVLPIRDKNRSRYHWAAVIRSDRSPSAPIRFLLEVLIGK